MPCRVGITTQPSARRTYWQNQVVGFRNWRILSKFMTREETQDYETWYSRRYGCHAAPGGADAPGTWYVYRFDYSRTRG